MPAWFDLRTWQKWLTSFFVSNQSDLGLRGEQLAEKHLKSKGYRILARRQRSVIGEIDLIALDQQTIVFVEVKTRVADHKGHPSEAITKTKQQKLTQVAMGYLKYHQLLDQPARFDVISVHWMKDQHEPQLEHYINAFESQGGNSFFG